MKAATQQQANEPKEWNVSFVDADHNRTEVKIEITYRNGYKEFSMTGDIAGSGGQCHDSIKPANDPQRELIKLWNQYHLNGMNAGTPKQQQITAGLNYDESIQKLITTNKLCEPMEKEHAELMVKIWNEIESETLPPSEMLRTLRMGDREKRDFFWYNLIARYGGNELILMAGDKKESLKDKAIRYFFAEETLLFDAHPETGQPYKYGSGWIKGELPEDIEEQVEQIIEDIESKEEERAGESLSDYSDDDLLTLIEEKTMFTGDEANLCAALVRMYDLCENDLEDIEIDGTRVTVQGTDYLAGTDSQMDEAWDEELENYIEECIFPELNERYQMYFDNEAWKRDAKYDGRGHALNRYDGGEDSVQFNGEWYYSYRQ